MQADRMTLKPQQHFTCSFPSETSSASWTRQVFLYKTWTEVVSFSTVSHFILSKPTVLFLFHHGFKYVSFTHFPLPSHSLLPICCCFSDSRSAFLSPYFFLHHRQWCLVNIILIHPSLSATIMVTRCTYAFLGPLIGTINTSSSESLETLH